MNNSDNWFVLILIALISVILWVVFLIADKLKTSFTAKLAMRLLTIHALFLAILGSFLFFVVSLSFISTKEAQDSTAFRMNEFVAFEERQQYDLILSDLYQNNCYQSSYDALWERIYIYDNYQRYCFYYNLATEIARKDGDSSKIDELQTLSAKYLQQFIDACENSIFEENETYISDFQIRL